MSNIASTTPHNQANSIFQNGSTTYFTASLFFSGELRRKVTTLYAFVRVVDDFVDAVPQQKLAFNNFYKEYKRCVASGIAESRVISEFVMLQKNENFDPRWIEAFFSAMRADLSKHTYETMAELDDYMYGSAEVIGLMMARLMKLPKAADTTARLLGKAMQYCNFLRDVQEDTGLGRTYIPRSILNQFGLEKPTLQAAQEQPAAFADLMRSQTELCLKWMNESLTGMQFIPWRERIAILTAAQMYTWSLKEIAANPTEVFVRKIKPSKPFIMLSAFKNIVQLA